LFALPAIAAVFAEGGRDIATLQYIAEHTSIATTMKYIHLANKAAQEKLRQVRGATAISATAPLKRDV
jgi:site-specific recombinase XerD